MLGVAIKRVFNLFEVSGVWFRGAPGGKFAVCGAFNSYGLVLK